MHSLQLLVIFLQSHLQKYKIQLILAFEKDSDWVETSGH